MSRRKISQEEAKLYWKLIKEGKTHIEAYELTEAAFYLNKLKKPNYKLPNLLKPKEL